MKTAHWPHALLATLMLLVASSVSVFAGDLDRFRDYINARPGMSAQPPTSVERMLILGIFNSPDKARELKAENTADPSGHPYDRIIASSPDGSKLFDIPRAALIHLDLPIHGDLGGPYKVGQLDVHSQGSDAAINLLNAGVIRANVINFYAPPGGAGSHYLQSREFNRAIAGTDRVNIFLNPGDLVTHINVLGFPMELQRAGEGGVGIGTTLQWGRGGKGPEIHVWQFHKYEGTNTSESRGNNGPTIHHIYDVGNKGGHGLDEGYSRNVTKLLNSQSPLKPILGPQRQQTAGNEARPGVPSAPPTGGGGAGSPLGTQRPAQLPSRPSVANSMRASPLGPPQPQIGASGLRPDDQRKFVPGGPPPGGGGAGGPLGSQRPPQFPGSPSIANSMRTSPPSGGNGMSGSKPIGGIELGATAELLGRPLPRITAVVADPTRNLVVLAGDRDSEVPGLRIEDLAMALWLVYGTSPQDPQFSLDPADPRDPQGKWLKAVYMPKTMQSRSFGAGLYEADFLLKQYAFGVRVGEDGKVKAHDSNVPGFKSMVQFRQEQKDRSNTQAQWARFWIVADTVRMRREENAIVFDSVRMRVNARRQVPDRSSPTGLRDVDTNEKDLEARWAKMFTKNYDQIAKESPAFERVRELAKAMAIAKWLKAQNVTVDVDWVVKTLDATRVDTVDKVSALSVSWRTEERKPITDARGSGIQTITTTLHVFGGVDLTVDPIWTRPDQPSRKVVDAIRAQLRIESASPVFTVKHDGAQLQALVLPVTRDGRQLWAATTRR